MATDLPVELWDQPDGVDDTYRSPIDTPGLLSWLRARGLGTKVDMVDGPEIPKHPGAVIVCTWLPGAGMTLEGALRVPGFQLRVMGPQNNRDAARELAYRIDHALVLAERAWPSTVGGRYVVEVRRSGGEPSLDRTDAAGRAHYVCTYLAETEA